MTSQGFPAYTQGLLGGSRQTVASPFTLPPSRSAGRALLFPLGSAHSSDSPLPTSHPTVFPKPVSVETEALTLPSAVTG